MLREIRINKGLSLRELAKISGISRTYLLDIERNPGKVNPTIDMIIQLEKSLNVEPGTIYLYFVYCRKNNIATFIT